MTEYPVLKGAIAKRGVKKNAIARRLGICDKSLNNKLNGRVQLAYQRQEKFTKTFFRTYRWIRFSLKRMKKHGINNYSHGRTERNRLPCGRNAKEVEGWDSGNG